MLDDDIRIWTMEQGIPTEIKMNDVVLKISKNRHYSVDPVEVAKMYIDTFESLPVKETPSGSRNINTISIFEDDLDWLYQTFKNMDFTTTDVYKNSNRRFGVGYIRIHDYLTYLEENQFVTATLRDSGSKKEKYYRFVVPIGEIKRDENKVRSDEEDQNMGNPPDDDIRTVPAPNNKEPCFIQIPSYANWWYKEENEKVILSNHGIKNFVVETTWAEILKLSQLSNTKLGNVLNSRYSGSKGGNANKRIALYVLVTAYQKGVIKPGDFKKQ